MPEELTARLKQLFAGRGIEIKNVKTGIIIYPETADAISQILTAANDCKTPIAVRQGKGWTSIDTDIRVRRSVTVDLRRMKRIDFHQGDWYAEVGPAVTENELGEYLLARGFWYPVDIGPVTMGSIVSVNMSGYQGTLKSADLVLGLEVVLPTGEIIETGGKNLRRPTGLDLTRLFVGNQCTLGVITKIRLKTIPHRNERLYAVAEFESEIEIAEVVKSIYEQKIRVPSICEFMDRHRSLRDLEKRNAVLLMATEHDTAKELGGVFPPILELCKKHGALSASQCDKTEWEVYWKARDSSHLESGDKKIATSEVIDTIPTALPDVMKEFLNIRDKFSRDYPEADCVCYGHIGASSLHLSIFCPKTWSNDRELELINSIRNEIIPVQLKYEATVGENALFPQYTRWLREFYGETYLSLIRNIKRTIDPNMILNPERIP